MSAGLLYCHLFGKYRVKLVKRARNARVYLKACIIAAAVKSVGQRDGFCSPKHLKIFAFAFAVSGIIVEEKSASVVFRVKFNACEGFCCLVKVKIASVFDEQRIVAAVSGICGYNV